MTTDAVNPILQHVAGDDRGGNAPEPARPVHGAAPADADDDIEHRLAEYDRASEYTGPLGTVAASAVYVAAAWGMVDGDRLVAWLCVQALAVGLMVGGIVSRRRLALSLPGHLLTGLAWGAVLLVGMEGGDVTDDVLWLSLAFQFAVTAGVLGGATVDDRPARAVLYSLSGVSTVVLLVAGEPVLAAGVALFFLIVARDLSIASSLVTELIDLRSRAARAARRSARDALVDPLTGLRNRSGLERSLTEGADFGAAMFVDLDRFKEINDRHGHHVGDRVLQVVGERLRNIVRDADLVARLGGDEFLVVVRGRQDDQQLTASAERIIAALETPIEVDGELVFVSASVGVAHIPPGRVDPDQVLRESDHAMYSAKRSGRRRAVLFGEGLRAEMIERASTTAALRRAVRNDEIAVWAQPIVELGTRRVFGVELLARWRSSSGELVPADRFIPIAEEIGMCGDIARLMLERAAELQAEWRDHDLLGGARIGVNVSSVDLRSRSLTTDVAAVLASSDVDPSRLLIEITESGGIHNDAVARRTIADLHEQGVLLVLDDVGTGFSALDNLIELPLDAVKIDRSLIAAIADDPRRVAVVRSVVQLARTLGRRVIAEGVETEQQEVALQMLDVEYAQGFHICRPMPVEDLAGPAGRAALGRVGPV